MSFESVLLTLKWYILMLGNEYLSYLKNLSCRRSGTTMRQDGLLKQNPDVTLSGNMIPGWNFSLIKKKAPLDI